MKINNEALCTLLNKVKRTQTVGGKTQDQVLSCIIQCAHGKAVVTSLVKDGLTSVSQFSMPCTQDHSAAFYITNIDTMLGALKYHAANLTLTQDGDKLRIKSSNKQTTLGASSEALAYPHNPKTLVEWANASDEIASRLKCVKDVHWVYKSEQVEIPATFVFEIDAVTLYEAVRCDSMNGQKINRYTFKGTQSGLEIETGEILKGKTKSVVLDNNADTYVAKDESKARFVEGERDENLFEATFEGGLEHLLSHYNRQVKLNIFDFTKYSQGWKVLFDFGNGDFVFQASITR